MINKVCPDSAAAVADIQDGSVIMVGGFGDAGVPENLIRALSERGAKDLVVISNSAGSGVVVLEESDGVVRNYLESEYCKKGLWVHFERRWRY